VIQITLSRDISRGDVLMSVSLNVLESHQKVTAVTASPAIRRENPWQQRGVAMPILLMALLALLVFGLIGILLTTAVVLEQSKRARLAKSHAVHAVPSVVVPSLHPKV
jgi:hypothetical protein